MTKLVLWYWCLVEAEGRIPVKADQNDVEDDPELEKNKTFILALTFRERN